MMWRRRLKTRVNFADSRVDRWQLIWLGAALVVLLGCAAFACLEHYNATKRRLQAAQPIARTIQSTAARTVVARTDEKARTEAVVSAQLNLPFFEMMKSLEPPRDIQVALLALDLRARTGQARGGTLIRLTSQAQALRDMTNYLEWLDTRKNLLSATLLKHQVQTQQPGQPVRFEVEVVAR